MDIVRSKGLKRKVSSAVSASAPLIGDLTGNGLLVAVLQHVAAFFGFTGLAHASKKGTVKDYKLASTASGLSLITILSYFSPYLEPLLPFLTHLTMIIGAAAAVKK